MLSSGPVNTRSTVCDFVSVFRTQAWTSSWIQVWETYLQEEKFSYNHAFYLVPQRLSQLSILTAIPTGCGSIRLRSIRSEYFQADLSEWPKQLEQLAWKQLIIPDVDLNAEIYRQLQDYSKRNRYFLLSRSVEIAYGITTQTQTFSDYLSLLSQSARARLFNKRKKLAQMGRLHIENIWPDLDRFIDLLNDFHLQRWGKLCYEGHNLHFIKLFLQKLSDEGGKIHLSLMTLDQEPISVLLDVEYMGRVYNFQAGFMEKIANSIALGSLHLGYAIEAAFSNPSITYYDFMAGQGKNSDYKSAFATHTHRLENLYIIKPRWLYGLYKLNDWLKRK
jgi:Acetyltransferase (GNAT) domain